MKLARSYLVLLILSIQYFCVKGFIFPVSSFGGYPNDSIDDTNATYSAIFAAIDNGTNNTVLFQSGTYDFSSTIYIQGLVGFTLKGQGIDQTLLLVHISLPLFFMIDGQRVTFTSFSIDFNPLTFTAGYVVNVASSYLDLRVVPPHQPDVGKQVGAIFRYDPILKKPSVGNKTYEIYQTPPTNKTTILVGNGTIRIYLQYPTQFAVGDAIVARYPFSLHAIYGQDMSDFTIQSLTIYGAGYFGIYTSRARRMIMIDYHVKLRDGRWLSTPGDCMHFGDSRESINIVDCSCEGQGDDGLNVQAFVFEVVQILNSTAIIVKTYNWQDTLNVGVGANLEFSANSQPFTPYGSAVVATSVSINTTSQLFTFTTPVSTNIGDKVCVADSLTLNIRNLTVTNNRGRGVLLSARNVFITKSLFNGTSSPAILLQPSLYWNEGPSPRNITLTENVFINCNEGLYRQSAVVSMVPFPTQLVPIMYNIQITASTFYNGRNSGSMIQCNNVDGVVISGNYLSTNDSVAPVIFCNSRNISAYNNTVINTHSVISQYYLYDNTSPCLANLSSIINVNAAAFNSSFPPPVIPTATGVQVNNYQTTTTYTGTSSFIGTSASSNTFATTPPSGNSSVTSQAIGNSSTTTPSSGNTSATTPAIGNSSTTTPSFGNSSATTLSIGNNSATIQALGNSSATTSAFGNSSPSNATISSNISSTTALNIQRASAGPTKDFSQWRMVILTIYLPLWIALH